MALKIGEAVQQLLTQGLDAATQVKLAKFQVNDPAGYVTGPDGRRVAAGQQAGISGVFAAVPPVEWLAGLAIVGVVIVLPLLRK